MLNNSDLKIIVIGNSGSGKTSFVNRWTKDIFSDSYKPTILSEFGFQVHKTNDGKYYRVQLWDIAGQDRNEQITKILNSSLTDNDRYSVILVDEAQDTNWIQFELMKMIS